MTLTVEKLDNANAIIKATISKKYLDNKIEIAAKNASKNMKVDGFRAGKIPVAIVKARFGDKLTQEAEGTALQELLQKGVNELGIKNSDIVGEPSIPKFEKNDDGINVEVSFSMRPTIDIEGYLDVVPEIKDKRVTAKEIDERISDLAKAQAPFEDIKTKRGLKDGDYAIFDFEGFVDGVPFEGGKAEGFNLHIGSGQFIPGFEDGMVGMKVGEEKTIAVKFPDDYQAPNLKGKDSEFKIKLHNIQQKAKVELNDETIKAMLPGQPDASLEKLKSEVKEQIKSEKMSKYYNEELKPQLIEILIEKFNFDLPTNVVDQEIDAQLNNKARTMTSEEIAELRDDIKKLEALRETFREDAVKSVKLTFIIDALARAEGVSVSDEELIQTLRYEAMMYGQDGDQLIKQYQEQNLLPMVKMSMIEDRLLTKLLDTKYKG